MQYLKKISFYVVGLLVVISTTCASAQEYHDVSKIKDTAINYIIEQVPDYFIIESLTTRRIDSRIKFKKCEDSLKAYTNGKFKINKRMTVGIRCNKPMWNISISINASILSPVVVANTSILRGETIHENQIKIVTLPITTSYQRYFKSLSDVVGKQARRSIKVDKPITVGQLQPAYIVKRKQEVIIIAKNKNLQVQMRGVALKNGKYNDLIKVRNSNSNKIIEAVVSGKGTVTVNF